MVAIIDLRSDTVTHPTPAMREAMYRAEVGDDVYGEDPTVDRLQRLAAEKLGKEAALFTTSGTQSNLVAALTHCGRGDEIIAGDQAHIVHYEVGGVSALGGIMVRTIPNGSGALDPIDVEAALRDPTNVHDPISRLVCLENTHNRCGGVALTPGETQAVADMAHKHGLKLHLDGARLFNAAVALGVLAAAGIVALEQMVDRLAEDHANARVLAEGIADIPGLNVELKAVQTNIVVADLARTDVSAVEFIARAKGRGIKVSPFGGSKVRFVTHYGISREDVETACRVAKELLTA